MKIKAVSLAAVLSLSVTGCASNKVNPVDDENALPDEFKEKLSATAEAIERSIRVYSLTNASNVLAPKSDEELKRIKRNLEYIPAGTEKDLYVPWHGEAQVALKTVARLTNYTLSISGPIPRNGAIVKLPSYTRPAIDIINDIGAQIDHVADINIVPRYSNKNSHLADSDDNMGVIKLAYRR